MTFPAILLRVLAFAGGVALVATTVISAIRSFVMPRSDNVFLTRWVFKLMFKLFRIRLLRAKTYAQTDRVMAFFAPVTRLFLPVVWMTLICLGYTGVFWALGAGTLYDSFFASGSSLLTLGLADVSGLPQMIASFLEATLGLGMVALLISYLPTMYSAFSRREQMVTMLEVRAGSPPSAVNMLTRYHRIHGLERLITSWPAWEQWFTDLEESHTSLAPLVFFRSPQPERSWVNAAATVLDAAALKLSVVDMPRAAEGALCLRAGFLALRKIADFFRIEYDPDPRPTDPISISRADFDAACEELAAQGVPLIADRHQAWKDFAGWRVNYDTVPLALARITLAPPARWTVPAGAPPVVESIEFGRAAQKAPEWVKTPSAEL